MFKHFLIPTDGSPATRRAAKAGIALARRLGAKITAYCALEVMRPIAAEGYAFSQSDYLRFDALARDSGRKRVEAIGKLARAAGVPYTLVVAKAPTPYEGIVAVAKKRKCDVIFMASHGRRGLSRLLMGSVTQRVLSHSTMPVVVYH